MPPTTSAVVEIRGSSAIESVSSARLSWSRGMNAKGGVRNAAEMRFMRSRTDGIGQLAASIGLGLDVDQVVLGLFPAGSDESDQGGADATTVFGNTNTDLLGSLGSDAVNGAEGLINHIAEEGVVLDQAAIDTNVDDLLVGVFELARLKSDGANGDSGQSGGTSANSVGDGLEGLGILERGCVDVEQVLQLLTKSGQLGSVVGRRYRHDGAVKSPGLEEAGLGRNVGGGTPIVGAGVEILEQGRLFAVNHVGHGKSHDLAQEHA